ncbi:transposase [Aphanizomenon sp. UHCC 0183]|jgi:putative transposase|uniref:transposase n=1 Tax=Aphanizomenon sp. UHCC 0183 TaxID=2590028 RepID=UPI0014461A80|nr:transposase [Aphanizomenon sp. UHCC 0183]MTJ32009.1 transposase [Aphanizomenon sp. UHCC 0183]
MKYNPDIHKRQSIRLQGYDYSQSGLYFITICCYERECLFGNIINSQITLNNFGELIKEEWLKSAEIRKEIELDEFVIMPNHFHGIVIINQEINRDFIKNNVEASDNNVGANGRSPLRQEIQSSPPKISMKPKSLSSLIAGFKSATTKKINMIRNTPQNPVWQRNYYDHIIRNDESLTRIREYLQNNPLSWENDQLHPNNPSKW